MLLLDTHAFIWFIDGNELLPAKVRNEIAHIENDCYISIASLWEIAIKYSNKRLNLKSDFHDIINLLADNNIKILPVEFAHLQSFLSIELIHKDPFDRIIIAQAIAENLTILTVDKEIVKYPVKCLW